MLLIAACSKPWPYDFPKRVDVTRGPIAEARRIGSNREPSMCMPCIGPHYNMMTGKIGFGISMGPGFGL